ncbi:MAG: hypothetical protein A2Y93_04865 [Chloroflexi bacterium RBG_13_68_17]|jgi:hypothetical protein|nr:MAG: hypothetical protein A2Y93_04865 [Chloroflexi bacterium RBG_13_68_17]
MKAKKGDRRVFEVDRRMELRLRLAAKRAQEPMPAAATGTLEYLVPDVDLLGRLIEKVRRL